MKKLLSILLTLIMCTGLLISCDNGDVTSSSESQSQSESVSESQGEVVSESQSESQVESESSSAQIDLTEWGAKSIGYHGLTYDNGTLSQINKKSRHCRLFLIFFCFLEAHAFHPRGLARGQHSSYAGYQVLAPHPT